MDWDALTPGMPIQARSILITGASSGIGAALAIAYSAPGVYLTLLGRDEARLSNVTTLCEGRGARATCHVLDVADQAAMAAAVTEANGRHPLDLVIANAGIARNHEDPVFARQLINTNIVGILNTVEPAIEAMLARKKGHIAIMSSLAAFRALGGPPGYAGSKAWARLYGEALRGRLASKGVAVSVICPGFVSTPMTQDTGMSGISAEDAAKTIISGINQNLARISFPQRMAFSAWISSVLPTWWVDRKIKQKWRKAIGG